MLADSKQQEAETENDAVAVISFSSTIAAAAKAGGEHESPLSQREEAAQLSEMQPVQSDLPQVEHADFTAVLSTANAEELQQEATLSPRSPRSWRCFLTGRQQQQQSPSPAPPVCLVLDGEALLWHELEEEQPHEQQQQQQHQQQQLLGHGRESGCSFSTTGWGQQPLPMHSTSSSPNLVLLADSSCCREQSQQQQSSAVQLPMHSSYSCSDLLQVSQAAGVPGAMPVATVPPANKSRLGRPASGASAPQQLLQDQQQQQQQQQKQVQQGHSPRSQQPVTGNTCEVPAGLLATSGNITPEPQATTPRDTQHTPPPGFTTASTTITTAAATGDASSHWALTRCNSGLSLSSDWAGLGRLLVLHSVTFNMNGKLPATLPPELLGLGAAAAGGSKEGAADLMVFATQENSSISDWEKMLSAALTPHGYDKLAMHSLRAIHLVLYAGRRFRRQVVAIRGSSVATGIGNLVGNKGAVALSVELLDAKLLFISSHLAAHGDQVAQRNADYRRIKAGLFAASGTSTPLSASLGSAASTTDSPRVRRASLQLQRPAMSAPPHPSMSDGGSRAAAGSDSLDTTGSSLWAGFLRSNRVADSSVLEQQQQQAGGVGPDSRAAAAACKHVSWWPEAPTASAASAGQLGSSTAAALSASAAPDTDSATAHLRGLRTASCPTMEQHYKQQQQQQPSSATMPAGHSSSDSSSKATSGDTTPSCSSSSPSVCAAEAASQGPSFLRSLVRAEPGRGTAVTSGVDVLEEHDLVLWLGDLNYRINGNAHVVRHLMRSRLHEVLHANDQLRLQQRSGAVFQGFQEGRIRFPPTFKFLPNSSVYSEKRVPSWTDRILWKVRSRIDREQWYQQQQPSWASCSDSFDGYIPPSVSQLYYTSVPEVTSSDHKPVIAGFEVTAAGAGEDVSSDEEAGETQAKRSRCCMM